ncbi:putative MFS-type transporter-like protein [Hapsidospora chrysogenum ATCC 11550]|uniref:Putative MFS-type transporter-like protein n=1 Tax=Hapsidospora chrysogenum (strain ATCC 11550 / CBS 779.69 / DSM 880 / IAM 14645 / JCM 23072 / IMI 49137) TaxID=857340 RepID=A0A086T2K6_HAPC1|nr:putative MFS-type transporter-like protein [Hapsidospora chrysogenum ATCC 11550]
MGTHDDTAHSGSPSVEGKEEVRTQQLEVGQQPGQPETPPPEGTEKGTWKLWIVIFILSNTFGLSFWPVPTTAAMQGKLAAQFGEPQSFVWFVPAYTTANSIAFILAGTNSDLFGRRIVLIIGNAICSIGFIVTASAHSSMQFTAGLGITGFGAGFCQMAMCSIPELMPNKYRHIGICIADGVVFIIVVIGPIVGRYAIDAGGRDWQYVFWVGFILQFITLGGVIWLYHPPKHPRGIPWSEALRGLDYVGTALIVPGICLTLVGIINTTYKPSSDVTVIAPLCAGLGITALFGVWENLGNAKYPLCPPEIFKSHNGREFTAPFILAFIVTMFYYGINIIYPTMINTFYITPDTPRSEELLLTLPNNLGLVFGAILLTCFGNLVGHWKWSLTVAWVGLSIFGGLLALVTPFNKGTMIAFAFLEQMFFGWAQYESIAFTQLGVKQIDLGVSGGLGGVARFAGGSLAQAVYTTILTNEMRSKAAKTVPAAAQALGLGEAESAQLLQAIATGASDVIAEIPGITDEIVGAASLAYKWAVAHGLKITALASLAFAGVGLICCLLLENIDAKMNDKTEVFLENDVNAEKNVYH